MLKRILFFIICIHSLLATAQITITGTVFDEYLEPFPGAVITTPTGKITSNYEGVFNITIKKLPTTILISSVGYSAETVEITDANEELNIILKEAYALDQIVISASRTPERIMESPVTIERFAEKGIKNTASFNFYEGLKNLKGIDVLDNSYLTKTVVSNRGFASTDNIRFVQLVDGVDTSTPVFEFSLGNTFGLSELDVKNVEILPGAASALYGANAFNGILLMTSKSPFEHQGLSFYTKTGFTSEKARGSYGFLDTGIRYAHKFSNTFAAKVNLTYQTSEDWEANDLSNINGDGFSHSDGDPNYDGVNTYGDEISLNLVDLAILADGTALSALNPLNLISSLENPETTRITRTGFQENSFTDYNVNNLLFDLSLHFKLWNDTSELIIGTKQSIGDNIAQLSNRYFLDDATMVQHRFELKNDNYFVRGYYTVNNAGNTYDSKLAGVFATQTWKDNRTFFTDYAATYFSSLANGLSNEDAHTNARLAGNNGQPNDVNPLIAQAKELNITEGGGKLFENSGFYNLDANWNLSKLINFENIQVGGNFRSFALDSQGQIYTDFDGILRHRLFGIYTQLQKKFANDKLKFTGTVRFDKARNFDGKFTPRATLSYAAGAKRDHNFRIGFQTGFRNPTSQDQYSGLTIGNSILLGSVAENLDRYSVNVDHVSTIDTTTLTGNDAFSNSFTAASVDSFQTDFRTKVIEAGGINVTVDPSLLVVSNFEKVKPETVRSYELGYRGAVDAGRLLEFDIVGYYSIYEDFITETEVVVPLIGDVNDFASGSVGAIAANDFQRFQIVTNAASKINAFGFSAGINTKLFEKFSLGASYAFSDFNLEDNEESLNFTPAFNTPKHSIKLQLNSDNLFKNVGFGIDARWQDEFLYQTRFISTTVDSRFVIDSQLNYKISSLNSIIKIGGTNLTGKSYNSIPESGTIGSQYYISWVFNN